MNKKNTEYLLKKYPNLYKQYYLSPRETAMCWGFSFGDGWFNIIDKLSAEITKIDSAIEAVQVKEKFGGLRFYLNYYNDDVNKAIERAEKEAYKTCEQCGDTDEVSQTKSGWVKTLCRKCKKDE